MQLELIFKHSNGTFEISSNDAQNAAANVPSTQQKRLKSTEVEKLLHDLVKKQWLRDKWVRIATAEIGVVLIRMSLDLQPRVPVAGNEICVGAQDILCGPILGRGPWPLFCLQRSRCYARGKYHMGHSFAFKQF
jgi:hypothetical protein